ncbi:PREDICTED: uncharacterized protein LOC109186623 isoform X2 [Ipomoea nil]|uniref:uncharacterized protein LOC109186623 isoform X2 n=1 Tax=Ipomoea nil TaxID=35883 RepID=UPI000901FE25|nr:PREDICTED: uncharacterized protein LOC109186623 isoform X2 [Ipomoea nil]
MKPRDSTAEIAPGDVISHRSPVENRPAGDVMKKDQPAVKLYGTPFGIDTYYLRFALQYKPVALKFVASDSHDTAAIEYESDVVSGSVESLVRYLDDKFPEPQLVMTGGGARFGETSTTPLVVWVVVLQHRSMVWHLERMVRWAEDLAARRGKARGDPAMGSPRMELKKFGRSYSQLLELLFEHAQMEEKVVFPILEKADRGLCRAANEKHARDLPVMNGIKEDIKSIGVLDSGKPVYQEALSNLKTRLKTLKEHSKQHFEEEERELLPLMEATDLSKLQQVKALEQCLDTMQGTHSHLFSFFMEGLLPRDAMHYMDIIARCSDNERVCRLFRLLVEKENSLGLAISNTLK